MSARHGEPMSADDSDLLRFERRMANACATAPETAAAAAAFYATPSADATAEDAMDSLHPAATVSPASLPPPARARAPTPAPAPAAQRPRAAARTTWSEDAPRPSAPQGAKERKLSVATAEETGLPELDAGDVMVALLRKPAEPAIAAEDLLQPSLRIGGERTSRRSSRRRTSCLWRARRSDALLSRPKPQTSRASLSERVAKINEPPNRDGHVAIDPEGSWYIAWLALVLALALFSVASNSYMMAFGQPGSWAARFHWLLPVEWTVDLLFVANVAIHLNVGFVQFGSKVMEKSTVRARYLYSLHGVADLVGVLPLDLLQGASGWAPAVRATKMARILAIHRSLDRIRASTLRMWLDKAISACEIVLFWLLFPHLCACVRILIGRQGDGYGQDSWSPEAQLSGDSAWTQYLHSLYWCMGLLTGYADGDVPVTVAQSFFTTIVINTGAFAFSVSVGYIGAIWPASSKRQMEFQVHVNSMHAFMQRHEVSKSLVTRITDFYAYQWKNLYVSEQDALGMLPATLRFEAVESMTADALSKVGACYRPLQPLHVS